MRCTSCKKTVPKGVRYCPSCGAPVKRRRKWPFVLLVVLLVVAALAAAALLTGLGGFSLGGFSPNSSDYRAAAESYTTVNEELSELVCSDEYLAATADGRAELVCEALDGLVDEGQVESGSVSWDEDAGVVSYRYANGAYGAVTLEGFAQDEDGVGTSSYATTYNAGVGASVKNIDASEDYTTFDVQESWPYEEESLNALVVRDLGEGREVDEQEIDDISSCWSVDGLTTSTEEAPTVASMRTQLAGYDLVVLRLHGTLSDGTPAVYLQESVGDTLGRVLDILTGATWLLSAKVQSYLDDLEAGRVGMALDDDGTFHFFLMPSFFSSYYGADKLAGTIVWIGCCDGYKDDSLVGAFASAGAEAVLGPTESIKGDYGTLMADAVVYSLLYGNTVDDSIEFARSVWGVNDSVWYATHYPNQDADETPAEFRAHNGGDATLVTLTAEAEESLSRETSADTDAAAGCDIAMVLDVSGSMAGEPIESTKEAAAGFTDVALGNGAQLSLTVFDDEASTLAQLTTSEAVLTTAIESIDADGGTDIEEGLRLAAEGLAADDASGQYLVLMSDGEPNNGLEGDELIAYAESIRDPDGDGVDEVIIYTLGFNLGSSGQYLLEGIASENRYYAVQDASDLEDFFADWADEINGVRYIYAEIACPVDVSVTYEGETLASAGDEPQTRTSFGTLAFKEAEDGTDAAADDAEDAVKVLRLREGASYEICIEGTGEGSMSCTVGFVDDDGLYSDNRMFSDIDVTQALEASLVAEVSDVTVLEVDEDGDGTVDKRYRAGANEEAELVDSSWVVSAVLAGVAAACVLVVAAYVAVNVRRWRRRKKAAA